MAIQFRSRFMVALRNPTMSTCSRDLARLYIYFAALNVRHHDHILVVHRSGIIIDINGLTSLRSACSLCSTIVLLILLKSFEFGIPASDP